MVWVYLLISLVAGALMPLQAGVNAQLSRWVGSAPAAALVSFAVGALGLFAYCAALRTQVPAWGRSRLRLGGFGLGACSERSS